MATINKYDSRGRLFTEGAPYGNVSCVRANMTLASGVVVGGDSTSVIGETDEVILGVLPEGAALLGADFNVSAAFTATSKGSLGFKYIDPALSTKNSPNYFVNAGTITAAGTIRSSITGGVTTLEAPAYLVYTNSVAAQAGNGAADITVYVEYTGKQ